MKNIKLGLLPRIVIAIVLGIVFGLFMPAFGVQMFTTFNSIFGNFLNFVIPLIILSLVAVGIADLGKGAGRLLGITALLAYVFTVFSGLFSFTVSRTIFPMMIEQGSANLTTNGANDLYPSFFTIEMEPVMGVMTALIAAFTLGLGMAYIKGDTLKKGFNDLKVIVELVISKVIIPLLPIYIFGIFLKMTAVGQVAEIMSLFIKVIIVIFAMTAVLLLLQFVIAGFVSKKNPWKLFKTMIPAYMTALGTQSSAATIPVTLAQTKKNGVEDDIAEFTVPLCATIHLSGSTLKIVACAVAIMLISGMEISMLQFIGFIMMLGVTMVAAPGVPGGAIMAALAVLESNLGFNSELQALMIALYIAMDSFGTATNVTGDGAISTIVDTIYRRKRA